MPWTVECTVLSLDLMVQGEYQWIRKIVNGKEEDNDGCLANLSI